MITHDDIQGSESWKARRNSIESRNASEAPIIMGLSPYVTRTELLDMKVSGTEQEFGAWFQKKILDNGHEVEAKGRIMANELIGDELYPLSGSTDDGYLSASFDGINMMETIIYECKQWNEAKAADVRAGIVPECDVWQVIQCLVVSGAEKCLYMVTDGTPERRVEVWRSLQPGEESTLRAAWAQFDKDRAAHVPKEKVAQVVANPQASLPVLSVEVTGNLAVIDNLDRFGEALTLYVEGLNMKPKDDQDFADLDAACKKLKQAEDELTAGEDRALSQAEEIEQLRRKVNEFRDLARTTRLRAEKVVKTEKDNRREEIRKAGVDAYRTHIDALNARLGRVRIPDIPADFAGVMKGKRTISSLEDAVSTELARVKIASNAMTDKLDANLKVIEQQAEYAFLFSDLQSLVVKDSADLKELIDARVANHKAEEQRKLDAEREKIRVEEEAKAFDKLNSTEERLKHSVSVAAVTAEKPRIRQQEAATKPPRSQIITTVALTFNVSDAVAEIWLMQEFNNK